MNPVVLWLFFFAEGEPPEPSGLMSSEVPTMSGIATTTPFLDQNFTIGVGGRARRRMLVTASGRMVSPAPSMRGLASVLRPSRLLCDVPEMTGWASNKPPVRAADEDWSGWVEEDDLTLILMS